MKHALIIFAIVLFSCKNNPQNETTAENKFELIDAIAPENIRTYIHHVDPRDSLCLRDMKFAKAQIDSGKIVFTLQRGHGKFNTRQSKRLKQLCKRYNLTFGYDEITDGFESKYERTGCYGAVMDEAIEKKFGKDFKKNLIREADELITANNDTVNGYECDVEPEIYGLDSNRVIYLSTKELKIKKNKQWKSINLYLNVYIDKSGKQSGHQLILENTDNLNSEREKLFEIAIAELKKYQKCKPGEVLGKKVITENYVTVVFD